MQGRIASYKESLSRIASDVLDASDELEASPSRSDRDPVSSQRRISRRFGRSPDSNGVHHAAGSENDTQGAENERLRASEAELKALALNYASMLKEKESQLSRLHDENSSLRKSTGASNGIAHMLRDNNISLNSNAVVHKEPEIAHEENNDALMAVRVSHEHEIKQIRMELKEERDVSESIRLKFRDAYQSKESSKKELQRMKMENERTSAEMKELQKKLDMSISEIKQLQRELDRKKTNAKSDEPLHHFETLEKENAKLKLENHQLKAAMEHDAKNIGKTPASNSGPSKETSDIVDQKEKEELRLSIQKLEKTLKDTYKERDKTQRELARLKQHLLDKELEESDKMDEDSKIIEELRAMCEHQKVHIIHLDKALKQEISKQEEAKNVQSSELQKLTEINNELKQKASNFTSIINSKNVELLNLQTALGQYYAESEAKVRIERDLAAEKEGSHKLSELLKVAKEDLEKSNKEKEDIVSKLLLTEKMLSETKHMVQKLQDDNSKLHRAVEQSMTRLNRMSMDSDYYVDRRIVIKLLVTYFQRNHSKEVLDLMVRMLGFSEDDKNRIGIAQQTAGKTVRGVFGLPGRLVGGILGSRSSEPHSKMPSEDQSFADLWVDFLLKDAEQREKRESAEADGQLPSTPNTTPGASGSGVQFSESPIRPAPTSTFPTVHSRTNQFSSPKPSLSESDSEFANIPLTSSASPNTDNNNSRYSRLFPKY